MTTPSRTPALITKEDDLFVPFEQAFERKSELIGLEAEKFGVFADGRPLHYEGPRGIKVLFDELVSRFGWTAEGEHPGGPPLQLSRDGLSITLEPGSQFELSGRPHGNVHAIGDEVNEHRRELAALESGRTLHWLGLGFHPTARQEDLDWVPKSRYPVMRNYLPTRGRFGLDMMRRSATVQANLDIHSAADAMEKLRVGLAISPIVQAMFACAQIAEGSRLSMQSRRGEVWLDMDNARAGLLPFAWRPEASLGDYVRWALDVPMFILTRGETVYDMTRLTFRDFMTHGFQEHHATIADWEKHLNTLFPEVRLKRTLEVRSADSVPAQHSLALPALWAGILYDPTGRSLAGELALPFGHDAWAAARARIPYTGLATPIADTTVGALARKLIGIAEQGLTRRAQRNAQGQDETIYLAALRACVEQGKSIGDVVLGDWKQDMPDALNVLLDRAAY